MAIEIVDFPIKNGGSFHSYVSLPEGILEVKVSLSFEGQPSMSGQWKHLSDNSSENYAFSVRFDVAINFADRFSQVLSELPYSLYGWVTFTVWPSCCEYRWNQ